MKNILFILLFLSTSVSFGQGLLKGTSDVLRKIDQLNLKNQDDESLKILDQALKNPANGPDDLIFLYTYKSGILLDRDSLKLSSNLVDQIFVQAQKTTDSVSQAMALRSRAYLNSYLNLTDQVIKDS